jgi:hypothetical protein
LKINDPKLVLAKKLHGDTSLTIDEICKSPHISRSTYTVIWQEYVARILDVAPAPAYIGGTEAL